MSFFLAVLTLAGFSAGTAVIDFESPRVVGHRLLDPFLEPTTGVIFSADRDPYPDSAVGLVWNLATSACVGPLDGDQKLGVGRSSLGDHSIGRGAAAITASFPSPLPPPVRVSAVFQAPLFQGARLRLFDPSGEVVGSSIASFYESRSPTCGGPGIARERVRVTVESSRPVARAVLDLPGGRVVFVVDDFTFETGAR